MIAQIIRQLISEWDKVPYEINNGDCEEFALEVIERLGGYRYQGEDLHPDGPFEIDVNSLVDDYALPSHVWVYYNGKHYDAECPDGVASWKQLPIFARLMEKDQYWEHYKKALTDAPEFEIKIGPREA